MKGVKRFKQSAVALSLACAGVLMACSSGDQLGVAGTAPGVAACDGDCAAQLSTDDARLLEADIRRVLAQTVAEAQAQSVAATIALSDRVGNVLAVYRMPGAQDTVRVTSQRTPLVDTGLENLDVPATLGAISKAVTGAYLSSEGNAFSTRTASQIVQHNFNPGETNQPAGPLFGVQFSQLACSDLVRRESDAQVGPKRAPLGLAADPGGFPLYKNGTVVGGLGVIADGIYGLDPVVTDVDRDLDEIIAVAGSFAYAAPRNRRGDRIALEGKVFRYSDADFADTLTAGDTPANLASLPGSLVAVRGYNESNAGAIREGVAFGRDASGYRPVSDPRFAGLQAFELAEADGSSRFPPRAATDTPAGASPLTENEVVELLRSALGVAQQGRSQIRQPFNSQIHVTVSVVDTRGQVLGVLRTRDGPVFGTDVSLQKARTAVFFSSADAGARLQAAGNVSYLNIVDDPVDGLQISRRSAAQPFANYVQQVRDVLGNNALTGQNAFADRSGGNLSRPFFPDGVEDSPPGPLSKPFEQWSPFSTGLQLDMSYERIIQHVAYVLGLVPDVTVGCSGAPPAGTAGDPLFFDTRVPQGMNNGFQIFPGSVPIYRDGVLIGGIGVSGDGVEQDDMISFLGTHRAGLALNTGLGNAPPAIRADQLVGNGVRLRYVQCPQAPFLDSDEQRACKGL